MRVFNSFVVLGMVEDRIRLLTSWICKMEFGGSSDEFGTNVIFDLGYRIYVCS